MNVRHFILATAGHVDHGKSTLVRRLTGTDPDRLPEEKARGMTIDLGFAEFSPDPTLSIGIVDVPGHEDFVRNMIAGVGAIDAAMLVVAADDGWMPQTQEHLRILEYLVVKRGIIVVTKTDRLSEFSRPACGPLPNPTSHANGPQAGRLNSDLQSHVADTFLESAPIIFTSIDAPIEPLRDAIRDLFTDAPPPPDIGKPRLQIDRSFLLRGVGRIVTGTLSGGTIARGQEVMLSPSDLTTKVRAIQSHGREIDIATPGMRVALNLPELPTDREYRGETVTVPRLAAAHEILDVLLTTPIKRGAAVQIHHGTRAVAGRVFTMHDPAIAQVRLQSPLAVFIGDRLVLRDPSHRATLGGAVVLDMPARRGGTGSEVRTGFLHQCAASIDNLRELAGAMLADRGVIPFDSFLAQSHFSDRAIADLSIGLRRDRWMIEPHRWSLWLDDLATAVRAYHTAHPERTGLPLADARALLQRWSGVGELAEVAADDLLAKGIQRSQAILRDRNHRPTLPARLQAAGARLRAVFDQHRMDPPTKSELATDAVSQQALAFLKINGEVIELTPATFIGTTAFEQARQRAIDLLQRRGRATVTELKTAMETSRRIAVPLLEKLDQLGVTRREGDVRMLKNMNH